MLAISLRKTKIDTNIGITNNSFYSVLPIFPIYSPGHISVKQFIQKGRIRIFSKFILDQLVQFI